VNGRFGRRGGGTGISAVRCVLFRIQVQTGGAADTKILLKIITAVRASPADV